MTGGWEGGQAEYARVAFADQNLLKIPDEGPDEKYLLLSVCYTDLPPCAIPSADKGCPLMQHTAGPCSESDMLWLSRKRW
jgi:hypothetical protein